MSCYFAHTVGSFIKWKKANKFIYSDIATSLVCFGFVNDIEQFDVRTKMTTIKTIGVHYFSRVLYKYVSAFNRQLIGVMLGIRLIAIWKLKADTIPYIKFVWSSKLDLFMIIWSSCRTSLYVVDGVECWLLPFAFERNTHRKRGKCWHLYDLRLNTFEYITHLFRSSTRRILFLYETT